MNLFSELRGYGRFAWGLRDFLREGLTLDRARAQIRKMIDLREENFLRLVERGIFDYPKSPYLPLLSVADCGLGDIKKMVRQDGIESTLHVLCEAGVYVTFEECKGKVPIVRDGKEYPTDAHSFDNPFLKAHYYSESGGSTGAKVRIPHDLNHLAMIAPQEMVMCHSQNVLDVPTVMWRGILPDGSGIHNVLRMSYYGKVIDKWFSPTGFRELPLSQIRFNIATTMTVLMGRFAGASVPWPRHASIENASQVLEWVADTLRNNGKCLILATVSRALRICAAATEASIDLSGALFRVAGEPLTPAKARGITSTGARVFMTYGFAEAGRFGAACSRADDPTDVHLMSQVCALIQYPREVPGTDFTVPAFHVTSMLPTTPRIMLNAQSDDFGIVEQRRCGCPFDDLGLHQHLRQIKSFSKLTGEGVTLVGSETIRILEEVLPARFGGGPLDYQLMEEEDSDGFTKVSLIVDPRLQLENEQAVIDTFFDACSKSSVNADSTKSIWSQANTLQIKRRKPIWTGRGKLMSLYVAKRYQDGATNN